MIDLTPYIKSYIKDWSRINDLEFYKWVAFKHYRENSIKEFGSTYERISTIYAKSNNLLAARKYFPLGVLLDMASNDGKPDELDALFQNLLQEGVLPTKDRVVNFITGTKDLMKIMAEGGYSDWKGRTNLQTFQDPHSVSVYLSMFYPNDFYIYKYGIFVEFAKIAQVPIVNRNAVERLFEYQALCTEVKYQLQKHTELIDFYKKWLVEHDFKDDNLNLLTQDFIYAIARHMNSDEFSEIEKKKERVGKYKEIATGQLKTTESYSKGHNYTGSKTVEYKKIAEQNEKLGFAGEMWVMNFEKERLKKLGISPDKVRHIAHEEGDGFGYDILSVEDENLKPRYIEVKTTSGNEEQPIFFSDNELNFSIENKDHYYLYRVYNFKAANKPADLTVIHDSLDSLKGTPVSYKAIIKY